MLDMQQQGFELFELGVLEVNDNNAQKILEFGDEPMLVSQEKIEWHCRPILPLNAELQC